MIILIEILIYQFKDNIYSEKKLGNVFEKDVNSYAWINKIDSDSLVILSGSSSVKYGLSCTFLNDLAISQNKYVNIASDARDPIQTYFILKSLDFDKICEVYFGLDPWIYTKIYYRHRDKYMYLDFNIIEVFEFFNEYDKTIFFKRYVSFINFIWPNVFYNSTNKNFEIPPDYGSVSLKKEAKNFDDFSNDWYQTDKYGWSDLQFIYLKKIEDLCFDRKVKFAVFVPPKRSDFSKHYKEYSVLTHKEFVNNLIEVNLTAPIFGKFDQLDDLGDSNNFVEAYHLNQHGQRVYSELFYELTGQEMSIFSNKYLWLKE